MRTWFGARLRRPSPGMVVALLALFVALGGTALAATGTIVNIADPRTAANVAKVDATGALKTAGTATVGGSVAETPPRSPFFGHAFVLTSSTRTLIAANKATVALTRLLFENHYDQTNSAVANLVLLLQGGNATTCDGSSGTKEIGSYDVPAGQTLADVMGSPIVLKPLVAGDVWCLTAQATLQSNPGGYFLPNVAFSGYVAAGTLPAGAVASPPPAPGAAPRASR
jgi:hypothetical protein